MLSVVSSVLYNTQRLMNGKTYQNKQIKCHHQGQQLTVNMNEFRAQAKPWKMGRNFSEF